MKHLAIVAFIQFVSVTLVAQRTAALELLAVAMEGSYTNAEQAKADTSYREIEVEMKRIWGKRKDGVWFYFEQAGAGEKDKPYRQHVYHLRQVNDSTFINDIYLIKNAATLSGAYWDPVKLDAINADSLVVFDGCSMTLQHRGNVYVGGTSGRTCRSTSGGATYSTSELSVLGDRLISWDRGYNDAGRQVWGAKQGGYVFIKRKKY